VLHISTSHLKFVSPAESHRVFGAGFLLIGLVMAAQYLAGGVWYQNKLRALIFPTTLILLGWGMIAVTAIEPRARLAHLAMGLPLLVGGWAQAKVQSGELSARVADAFIVVGLLNAAIETTLFHLGGPPSSGVFITHAGLVISALVIAFLRWHQGAEPTSLSRALFTSGAVFVIGVELYVDAIYQPSA
jgi:hypothetical protein